MSRITERFQSHREDVSDIRKRKLTVMEGHAMMAVARLVRGPRVTNVYCNQDA
jgi:hypothetical protein